MKIDKNLDCRVPFQNNHAVSVLHGLGVILIVTFWLLNWTVSGLRTHWGFFPLWLGYCLVVDRIAFSRCGSSPLTRNYRAYLGLFGLSIPVWWLFELINWHTQNWFYQGKEHFGQWEFFFLSSLAFSVVIPAVFVTAEVVGTFAWVKNLPAGPRFSLRPGIARRIFSAGLTMMTLIALWPEYFYPLVWGSLYLVIESINLKRGYRTLVVHLAEGDWRQVVSLGLGSLICGFFWELWNYYSYPKWVYHVPHANFMHVFEMPILGYLGYLPFALELFALYHFAIGVTRHDHLHNYVLPPPGP